MGSYLATNWGMKPAQLASLNSRLPPIEEDLAVRMEKLIARARAKRLIKSFRPA